MVCDELLEEDASPGVTMSAPASVDRTDEQRASSASFAHGMTEAFTFPLSGRDAVFEGSRITAMPVWGGPPFYMIAGSKRHRSNDDA